MAVRDLPDEVLQADFAADPTGRRDDEDTLPHGHVDLVVGYTEARLRLVAGSGDRFRDATEESGFSAFPQTRQATGLVLFDWDQDGDLDLFANSDLGRAHVLINSVHRPDRTSLCVRLPASVPGALVQVLHTNGKRVGSQRIGLVDNYSVQRPPEALFALVPGSYRVRVRRGGEWSERLVPVKGPRRIVVAME